VGCLLVASWWQSIEHGLQKFTPKNQRVHSRHKPANVRWVRVNWRALGKGLEGWRLELRRLLRRVRIYDGMMTCINDSFLKVFESNFDKVLRFERECVQENKYGKISVGDLVFPSQVSGLSLKGPD
jgi:hypothetical protein